MRTTADTSTHAGDPALPNLRLGTAPTRGGSGSRRPEAGALAPVPRRGRRRRLHRRGARPLRLPPDKPGAAARRARPPRAHPHRRHRGTALHRGGEALADALAECRQVAGLLAAMDAPYLVTLPAMYTDLYTGELLEPRELTAEQWTTLGRPLRAGPGATRRESASGRCSTRTPTPTSRATPPSTASSSSPTRPRCRCAWTPDMSPTRAATTGPSSPPIRTGSGTCTSSPSTRACWPSPRGRPVVRPGRAGRGHGRAGPGRARRCRTAGRPQRARACRSWRSSSTTCTRHRGRAAADRHPHPADDSQRVRPALIRRAAHRWSPPALWRLAPIFYREAHVRPLRIGILAPPGSPSRPSSGPRRRRATGWSPSPPATPSARRSTPRGTASSGRPGPTPGAGRSRGRRRLNPLANGCTAREPGRDRRGQARAVGEAVRGQRRRGPRGARGRGGGGRDGGRGLPLRPPPRCRSVARGGALRRAGPDPAHRDRVPHARPARHRPALAVGARRRRAMDLGCYTPAPAPLPRGRAAGGRGPRRASGPGTRASTSGWRRRSNTPTASRTAHCDMAAAGRQITATGGRARARRWRTTSCSPSTTTGSLCGPATTCASNASAPARPTPTSSKRSRAPARRDAVPAGRRRRRGDRGADRRGLHRRRFPAATLLRSVMY